MRGRRLHHALVASSGTTILLGALAGFAWGFARFGHLERDRTMSDLRHKAPLAASIIGQSEGNLAAQCQLISESLDVRISVLNVRAEIIADSEFDHLVDQDFEDSPDVIMARTDGIGTHLGFDKQQRRSVIIATATVDSNSPAKRYVRISKTEPSFNESVIEYGRYIAIPSSILLVSVLLGSMIFMQRVRKNVNLLRDSLSDRLTRNKDSIIPSIDIEEFEYAASEAVDLQAELSQATLENEERNNQWRALFANMGEGILVVDDGDIVALANPATSAIFRIPMSLPLAGQSIHAHIRNAALFDLIKRTRDNGFSESTNIEVYAQQGAPARNFLASTARFSYKRDGTSSTLIVLTDITRIRRLESMREEFVANVSHELKTPLTAITGSLETIEDCLDEPVFAKKFLGTATRHAARMNAIIDDLLYLSRLEQGDGTVASSSTLGNLRDLAAKCLRHRKQQASDRQITLVTEVPSIKLMADYSLLEQALDNLVTNAIKYSPQNTSVTIFSKQTDTETTIGVTDTGAGIPEEHVSRIFERFYRVDKSRDRNTGGTGLGLSIVKHVALVHGGSVSVESTTGKGSMFCIHLPRNVDHS